MKQIASVLFAVSASTSAWANFLTIDGATAPSNGDCTFACVAHYQQAYDNSLFGNQTISISGVDFLAASTATWGTGNMYRMSIGVSPTGVNALSPTFNTNTALGVTVFDYQSFGTTTAGSWFGFGSGFNYTYNPLLGDLIIDIQLVTGSSGGSSVAYNWNSGGEFSRVYSWTNTTTGNVTNNYGNVTRFEYTLASPVPVPSSLLLLGAGLLGFGVMRRKDTDGV